MKKIGGLPNFTLETIDGPEVVVSETTKKKIREMDQARIKTIIAARNIFWD